MRLIDADALNKEVGELWRDMDDVDFGEMVRDFWKVLNHFPTVDAEPVKYGVWVPIDDEPHEDFECSVCGYVSTASFDCSGITPNAFPYCPMCGAKMGEGETDEDAQSR